MSLMQYCGQCGSSLTHTESNSNVCDNGHKSWQHAAPGSKLYLIRDNQILFSKRAVEPGKGKLDIPGGFMQLGESFEATALRELKEEAGITVLPGDLQFLGSYPNDYCGEPSIAVVFIVEYAGIDEPVMGDDVEGVPVWRALNSLPVANELAFAWQVSAQRDLMAWWQARNA